MCRCPAGYYGRPFEARNKPRGGAFTGDEKEFYRFKLGQREVIPAFEEAVAGMQVCARGDGGVTLLRCSICNRWELVTYTPNLRVL